MSVFFTLVWTLFRIGDSNSFIFLTYKIWHAKCICRDEPFGETGQALGLGNVAMTLITGCRKSLLVGGSLVATVLAGCVLRLMPLDIALGLSAWTVLALPVSIAFGYCTLSD